MVTLSKAAFQYKGANQEVQLPDIIYTHPASATARISDDHSECLEGS